MNALAVELRLVKPAWIALVQILTIVFRLPVLMVVAPPDVTGVKNSAGIVVGIGHHPSSRITQILYGTSTFIKDMLVFAIIPKPTSVSDA